MKRISLMLTYIKTFDDEISNCTSQGEKASKDFLPNDSGEGRWLRAADGHS